MNATLLPRSLRFTLHFLSESSKHHSSLPAPVLHGQQPMFLRTYQFFMCLVIGAIHNTACSITSCCFSRSARTKSTTTTSSSSSSSLLSFFLQPPHGSITRRYCKNDRRSNPTIKLPPQNKLYSSSARQQRPSSSFHPLGPPESLSHLAIGDECCISIRSPSPLCISSPISSPLLSPTATTATAKKLIIQRLSQNPDIFLAKNFLSQEQTRSNLIQYATKQGMKVAGTRQSLENTVRKNSYLTWLNRHEILSLQEEDDEDNDTDQDSAVLVANILESMGQCVLNTFLHESLQSSLLPNQKEEEEKEEAVNLNLVLEDLQIAKYDQGGKFEEHHDGYGRFLTVLTYLNGVGGTFFPFAQTRQRQKSSAEEEEEEEERLQLQTRDGLLVVGKEGIEAYNYTIPTTRRSGSDSSSSSTNSGAAAEGRDQEYQQQQKDKIKIQPATVVHIEPGDALVFYNYLLGKRDLQSVHESLTVPCEKWIATNWVRCENLTGPLAHLYYERLVSSSSMYYPRQQEQQQQEEEERDSS